jgi:pimeloyl-ACP methyl ester carboxylesterase
MRFPNASKLFTTKLLTVVKGTLLLLISCTISLAQTKESFKLLQQEKIDIEGEKYVLERGEIVVPEDRSVSNSRTIILPVQIIRSNNKNGLEPIFWLDGGPGASNILSVEKVASTSPHKLLENHDLVCVGYRGVDGSTRLFSKKVNKAIKGVNHKMLSDKSLNNIESKIMEYSLQLKKDGIDINRYTIIDVIDDIDHARKVLGYSAINLLSASYGTRISLLYSYRYPKVIKRTVMIGACPPGYFLTRQEQAEDMLNVYDSLYKTQVSAENKGSIKIAMQKALANLPKRWSTFRLDADKIKAGTVSALYARGFAVWAFHAYFKAANEGDYSGLFMLQKIQDMNTKAVIGDVYSKTVSADIDESMSNSQLRETLRNSTTTLGNNIAVVYGSTAHAWNIKSIPAEYKKSKLSESETLVVSGDLDFRTPANITNKELMPFLKKGKHVVLKHMSHSDILQNVMKSQDFLYQYFDFGIVDQSLVKPIDHIDFTAPKGLGKLKVFVVGLLF